MKRSKNKQSKHDETIRRSAGQYKSMGYKVHADIKGYPQPRTIYNKRPDLIAQKGQKKVIVEVETPSSYHKDVGQRNTFKRYARENKGVRFRTKISR